jgi:hypothetical protein
MVESRRVSDHDGERTTHGTDAKDMFVRITKGGDKLGGLVVDGTVGLVLKWLL